MDIIIRKALPVNAEAVAKVHVQSWQETYRGIMEDEYLDKLSIKSAKKCGWIGFLRSR